MSLSGAWNTMGRHPVLVLSVAGAVAGCVVLHPYVLLSYLLLHPGAEHPHLFGEGAGFFAFYRQAQEAFHQHWSLMSVSFALFGLLAGAIAGLYLKQHRRYEAELQERARREAALETLRQLMVTLSHYLLNIAVVVGGQAQRALREDPEGRYRDAWVAVREKAREMETVVASLQALTEVRTELYREGGKERMIDIQREMEERLHALSTSKERR